MGLVRASAILGLTMAAIYLGGLLLFGSVTEKMSESRETPDLADLPRQSLGELLGQTVAQADAVVFQDGADGWFLIRDPGALADVQIGFYGPRLGDVLFGARHIATSCGADETENSGKSVWEIVDGQIGQRIGFCYDHRMDLATLRPLAEPVTLHEADMTRQEVEALQARLAADPALMPISVPPAFEPFDQTRLITLPAYWHRWGVDEWALGTTFKTSIEAALRMHLAAFEGQYSLTPRDDHAQELTIFARDGSGNSYPEVTGPTINADGRVMLLTEVNWITIPRYVVGCEPAACAALEGFDPVDVMTVGRDMALLNRALASAIPMDRGTSEGMVTPQSLRRDGVLLGPVTTVVYRGVKWMSPRP